MTEKTALTTGELLPVVPMRDVVLFPGMVLPIGVGREESVAAVHAAIKAERPIALFLQRDPEVKRPGPDDLHRIGSIASVARFLTAPDGNHHLVCQGITRCRGVAFSREENYLSAYIERLEDPKQPMSTELEARVLNLRRQALEALELLQQTPTELVNAVRAIEAPGSLADLIASYLDLKPKEKQEILEAIDLDSRLGLVDRYLARRLEVLRISSRISRETQEAMSERQREYVLREQLRQIQKELGEGDQKTEEIKELNEKIEQAVLPPAVHEQADRELKRLERMPEGAAEYSMVRTYLDWLVELPWQKASPDTSDIEGARQILDADHHDLAKIKRRILEFLAVHMRNPEGRSPILCFVGPPGVGKTSLGRSIARAMGRQFERISLGGMHDESEIRGHRRTYIGAMPGNIIRALRKAGTNNPVFMLDELDKLGVGFQGDPAAALLEVLDPEQNVNFRDTYLDVDFDLSKVIFIGTANVLDQIPGPLRDRLEIIELPGYTEYDKVAIAKRYLIDRQLQQNGLTPEELKIDDNAITALVRGYTREAGVRGLERQIGAICRYVTTRIAEGEPGPYHVEADDLSQILGAVRYENETALRTSVPGVATGLAWTPVGGDILFVEATRLPGKGKMTLTGQLGEVMKESVEIAFSLVKSRAQELGLEAEMFATTDIHVHVPAGAIPKDGPSAGVTMTTALVSLLTGRRVKASLAMTGEITLRGLVLPVGGIKEKVLAAQAAGIRTVILPERNRKDYEDIPEHAREALDFVWAGDIDTVLEAALEPLEEESEEKQPVTA